MSFMRKATGSKYFIRSKNNDVFAMNLNTALSSISYQEVYVVQINH